MVTDGSVQRTSVWSVLHSGIAEAADGPSSCRSSSSLLDFCYMLMQSRCRLCPIGGACCHDSSLNCCGLKSEFSSGDASWFEGVLVAIGFEPVAHPGACWYGGKPRACALVSLHSRVRSLIAFCTIRPSISHVMRPWPHVQHTEQVVTLRFSYRFWLRWLLQWVSQYWLLQLVQGSRLCSL